VAIGMAYAIPEYIKYTTAQNKERDLVQCVGNLFPQDKIYKKDNVTTPHINCVIEGESFCVRAQDGMLELERIYNGTNNQGVLDTYNFIKQGYYKMGCDEPGSRWWQPLNMTN
jgi:hypothetical protein